MLGTDSKNLSKLIHFLEDVHIEHLSASFCSLDQPCQHTDSCCFTSTIVSKESEYLAIVHSDVRIFDGDLHSKLLSKALDLEALPSELLLLQSLRDSLEVK